MKPKFHFRRRHSVVSAFSSVIAFAMTLGGAQAASQTWDGATNATWNTTTGTNWAGVAWTNGNDAVFGATGVGTITNAGVTAHNITFNTAGYTISGGVLSLSGATPTITTAAAATISSVISGPAGLAKAGAATLTLSGANNYTGGTSISAGTLLLSGAGTLGDTGNTLSITGGTLDLGNTNQTVAATTLSGNTTIQSTGGTKTLSTGGVTVNGSNNTIASSAIVTGAVGLNPGAALADNGSLTGNLTVGSGTLTGSGSVTGTTGVTGGTINGSGLTLTGVTTFNGAGNTLGGSVNSTNGVTLASGAALALNAALSGNLTVGNGTITGIGSVTGTTSVTGGTLNGTGLVLTGVTTFNGLGNTLSGTMTSISGVTMNAGAALAVNGVLGGNLTVGNGTLTGTGTVNGTTGVTGGTINGSGLTLTGVTTFNGAGNTLGGSVNSTNGVTLASGAALALNAALSGNLTVGNGTITGIGSVTGTTSVTGGTLNGTGLVLTGVTTFNGLGNTLSGTMTSISGVTMNAGAALALNGALTGTLAVGNGTLTGTGGSVSGATTLNGGTINLTSGTLSSTLGVTGGNWNGAGSVTGAVTSSSGTFTIGAGANLTANGGLNVTGGGIAGTGTITGNVNYTSSTSSTFGGGIAGAGKTLTMNGTGATLTLTGSSTYTGTTTISAGTLKLDRVAADNTTIIGDGNTATTSDIVINGGTLEVAASEQIANTAAINMSSGGFNFGAASGLTETIDKFTNSGGVFTTGANTLIGLGSTVTWSGGTNTVSNGGLVQDAHMVISGGTNTVQGGATGGVLQLDASGAGLEMSNGATLTLNSDNAVAGKLVLKGDVSTSGNATVTIANGGANTHKGTIDLNAGTRTFTVADGSASTDLLVSAVIANGALTKEGLGNMELSGANTYTGTTNLNAGMLTLTGSLNSGLVNIAAGTTLDNQNGGLAATSTVNNLGTLTMNNVPQTIGTLNNTGNISVTSLVTNGSDTNFTATTVALNPGSTLTLTNSTLAFGPGATIFHGAITGSFDSITAPSQSTYTYGFDPTTGKVQVIGLTSFGFSKSSDTIYNLNKNQTFVTGSLFEDTYHDAGGQVFVDTAPGKKNFGRVYFDELGNPTNVATPQWAWKMTGMNMNADPALLSLRNAMIAIQSNYQLIGTDLVVGPQGKVIINQLSPEVHRGMVDYTEQALRTHVREGVDAAPVAQSGQTQVFATLHTSTAGALDETNNASYNTDMYGATVGARYDITKDFQIGGLLGADEGTIKGSLIDTDATGLMFGIFGRYVLDQATKTTVTGSLSYGSFSYDATRHSYGTSVTADGINSDAFEMSLGIRTTSLESGGLKLIPNASVRYIKGTVDGFTENGGQGVGLKVASQDISSMVADVGVDIEYKVMEHLTLLGNVSYVTDFLDGNKNVSAQYAAAGLNDNRAFSVTAPGIDDQGLVLSIGAQYDLSGTARIGVNYRNEFHQSSRDAQTVGIGASFGF